MSGDMAHPSWQMLVDAISKEADPRRRGNLEIVARHVIHEVAGELPELMSTLTEYPVYRFWGPTDMPWVQGSEGVLGHYTKLIEIGKNRLEFEINRVVVDENTVVTEGDFIFAYPGAAARAISDENRSEELAGDPLDDGSWYLVKLHSIVVWPIDENGLIGGEDIWAGHPARLVRKLEPGEMPSLGLPSRAHSPG